MAAMQANVYHRGGQSCQQKGDLCLTLLIVCNVTKQEV